MVQLVVSEESMDEAEERQEARFQVPVDRGIRPCIEALRERGKIQEGAAVRPG